MVDQKEKEETPKPDPKKTPKPDPNGTTVIKPNGTTVIVPCVPDPNGTTVVKPDGTTVIVPSVSKDETEATKKENDHSDTDDASPVKLAKDALKSTTNFFTEIASVESNDPVTRNINNTFKAVGGGISKCFKAVTGVAGAMSKNKEGQAWLSLLGGLGGAIFLSRIINGKLDEIGVGKWPVIGTLLKLASFAALFMTGRIATHGALNHFIQGDGNHAPKTVTTSNSSNKSDSGDGDSDDSGDSGDGEYNKTYTEKIKGQPLPFKGQLHNGNLPYVPYDLYLNEKLINEYNESNKDGDPLTKEEIINGLEKSMIAACQSNTECKKHMPINELIKEHGINVVEIMENKKGGDVVYVDFTGDNIPEISVNLETVTTP